MFERLKSVFGSTPQVDESPAEVEKGYTFDNISSLSDIASVFAPENMAVAEFDYSKNIREAYLQNVISYYCTELISNLATQPRWELYVNGKEVTKDSEAGDALAIYRFLKRPNQKQTLRDFIKNYIIHDYLAGESFMYRYPNNRAILRGNGEVRLIEPNEVTIIEPSLDYQVNPFRGSPFKVPARNPDKTRDMLHRAHWHPTSIRGTSALTPAWSAIQNFNNALKWNSAVLNNSARMSLVAVLKSTTANPGKNSVLSNEQMRDLQTDLARFSSPKGRGKPFVISGDWDFKELGQNNQELEFTEGLNSMSRMIALSFGVDPVLLSLPGDSTYNNKKEATSSLFKLVVLPKLQLLMDDLSAWFKELNGAEFELKLNLDDIPALEGEREKLWERQGTASTVLTINERRALLGYEPIDGGDVLETKPEPFDLAYSVDKELISKQTAFNHLKKNKVIPLNRSFMEEQELINTETGMIRHEGLDENS